MKVLKTIVATAVIVFALTSVAMAGVQHFTKQSGQTTGSQAQTAQPTFTVTHWILGVGAESCSDGHRRQGPASGDLVSMCLERPDFGEWIEVRVTQGA